MSNYNNYVQEKVLDSAYTLTDTEAEFGNEINTIGVRKIVLYVTLDVNNSLNVRIRPNFRLTTSGSNYLPALEVISATETKIQDNYFELDNDADQRQIIEIPLDGCVPFVKLSAWAGTVGVAAGSITSLEIIKHRG